MTHAPARDQPAGTRSTKDRIVDTAMRQFAERGYLRVRVEDIAAGLDISKGAVFKHFKSKAELFQAAWERAVKALPAWLDAPPDVLEEGFFAVVSYWLRWTEHLMREDWAPYRVCLIGEYATDLTLKRELNRFYASEDPHGTLRFVEFGVRSGEVRDDIDPHLIAAMLDWLGDRIQDALVTEELDPGLFHRRHGEDQRRDEVLRQFVELLRGAIGRRNV